MSFECKNFNFKNFDYKRLIKFEHNIGAKDKKIRLFSGVALLFVSLFTASILLLVVGVVLVASSYFGWCPVYSGFACNSLCKDAAPDVGADADGQ